MTTIGIPYATVEYDSDGATRVCPVCGDVIPESTAGYDGELISNNYGEHYANEHSGTNHVDPECAIPGLAGIIANTFPASIRTAAWDVHWMGAPDKKGEFWLNLDGGGIIPGWHIGPFGEDGWPIDPELGIANDGPYTSTVAVAYDTDADRFTADPAEVATLVTTRVVGLTSAYESDRSLYH